jgi:hypothetical protein
MRTISAASGCAFEDHFSGRYIGWDAERDAADRTASAEMVLNTESMGITAEMVLIASGAYCSR